MMMTDEIRERAQAAMKKSGMTQEQLAKAAGVRQATVSRFLSGDRNRAADAAVSILEALGLELTTKEKGE